MTINLINDPWIPIRREDGSRELIVPWQLAEAENPVMAVEAPRPDFNSALTQFLIGLLQTCMMPKDHNAWLVKFVEPPGVDEVRDSLQAYAHVFELAGDKARFMQDFDELVVKSANDIGDLLIEAPGEQTIKQNKDHFIKRGQIGRLCPSCAATALFTLQTNAPSGGQGHRTSLRGGGPLTTLVVMDERSELPNTLWNKLWLNVLDRKKFREPADSVDSNDLSTIFPWLAPTRTSEKGAKTEQTTPEDVHPLQAYWGMPRRIRLHWHDLESGRCDLCNAESDQLIKHYDTKNYGINYTGGWLHPLSPYSKSKDGEWLAKHAQPGGFTYRHWLSFVEEESGDATQFSAQVVRRYRSLVTEWGEQFRLQADGYDMDNMKARCWYETTYPLLEIDKIRPQFAARVEQLVDLTNQFSGFLRSCVKDAWFSRSKDVKGDTSFLIQSLYEHTQAGFDQALLGLKEKLPEGQDKDVLESWYYLLRKETLAMFDYWVMSEDFTQSDPARIARAHNKLQALVNGKKLRAGLGLSDKAKEAA